MVALGFILAALIGLSLGLLGGGGSILTVPVFVYVLGIAAKPAIAMSLPVVGEYNVSNLLGVLAAVRALGVPLARAVAACAVLSAVPGRMQPVAPDGVHRHQLGVAAFTDYPEEWG